MTAETYDRLKLIVRNAGPIGILPVGLTIALLLSFKDFPSQTHPLKAQDASIPLESVSVQMNSGDCFHFPCRARTQVVCSATVVA
jgi:hypothetical protein